LIKKYEVLKEIKSNVYLVKDFKDNQLGKMGQAQF
jgi:hypothetical protein